MRVPTPAVSTLSSLVCQGGEGAVLTASHCGSHTRTGRLADLRCITGLFIQWAWTWPWRPAHIPLLWSQARTASCGRRRLQHTLNRNKVVSQVALPLPTHTVPSQVLIPSPTYSMPAQHRGVFYKPKHIKLTVHVHSQTVSFLLALLSCLIVLCLYSTLLFHCKLGQDLTNLLREPCMSCRVGMCVCEDTHLLQVDNCLLQQLRSTEVFTWVQWKPCMQHALHTTVKLPPSPLTATSFCH